MINETLYPETAKVEAIQEKSQTIGEFLEWLRQKYEICSGHDGETGEFLGEYYPIRQNIEQLLAEYFEIDLKKFNDEKEEMYGKLVAAAKEREAKNG